MKDKLYHVGYYYNGPRERGEICSIVHDVGWVIAENETECRKSANMIKPLPSQWEMSINKFTKRSWRFLRTELERINKELNRLTKNVLTIQSFLEFP